VCAQHGRGPDGVQVPCVNVEHDAKGSWEAAAEVKVGRATVRLEPAFALKATAGLRED
jgi:hypothetical protein